MRRVEANTELLLDHMSHARTRPERGGVPVRFRPIEQHLLEPGNLFLVEARFAAGSPGALEATAPRFREHLLPAVHGLPIHTEAPSDVAWRYALFEKLCCCQPAPLERFEVPPHPCRIAHAIFLA